MFNDGANMKIAHNVTIKVFAKEGEDAEKIKKGLSKMIPLDFDKEKIKIDETTAEGFENKKINIFEIKLEKERHITKFFENLLEKISERQKDMLLKQIDSRIDEECNFFIRLDKEKIFDNGYLITDSGDCYHIKTAVAAYPSKKEAAKKVIEQMIKSSKL